MFEGRTPVPLSATILYFERGAKPELIAYDLIEQSPTTGRLTIQRRLASEASEINPSPTASPTGADAASSRRLHRNRVAGHRIVWARPGFLDRRLRFGLDR